MEKEEEFLKLIKDLPKAEKALIIKAFNFAKKMHAGQRRQSKDDYFTHPLAVAINLQKRFGDVPLTVSALLHDTAEDCPKVKLKNIYRKFGKEVGFLVDAVTKINLEYYKSKNKFRSKVGKLLWGGIKDARVLVLKIADREHNLADLDVLIPNKQIKISFETQAVYHPLREILNYAKAKDLEEIKRNFDKFLKQEKIKDQHDFRQALFNNCFSGMDRDMYDIVYNNSEKIIWVVKDKSFFESMCRSKDFDKAVENMKIWTDGKNFKAMFNFKKGIIFKNGGVKYNVFKYKS